MRQAKPLIFFAFANDREGKLGYLRLAEEARGVREALAAGRAAGLWEVEVRTDCTLAEILDVFQDYRDRIAIFHFGGHAGSYELLLQLADGRPGPIDAAGLAAFLGQQRGLQLAFLNGCSTGTQAQGLLDANVSAVITTSSSIDDEVATAFACRFYQGLASGAGLQVAFDESAAAIRMARGGTTRGVYRKQSEHDGSWPWALRFRNGAEEATGRWSLGEAGGDPLFGLPPVPAADLPEIPYRHLQWFNREHAEVFFGRGREIREMYARVTSSESPPILLLYGQSGVGKSSLLDAGLLPRLDGSCQSRYVRRIQGLGLLGTLQHALGNGESSVRAAAAWRALEQAADQPVIVVLDQAEEVFTRPDTARPNELSELAAALVEIFSDPVQRPRGKLVLSFRKEWLAEIDAALAEAKLPRAKVFLARLGREGIIEAVTGPARVPRLRDQWGLTIEDGVAELIADELLEDPDSNIGPTLQILLSKMWAEATKSDASHPLFDRELYLSLKRKGVLLKDFLDQQLAELRHRWNTTNAMADTGLSLDILHYHTTPLGTAERRTPEELAEAYGHVGRLMSMSMKGAGYVLPENFHSGFVAARIQDFKDLSLLVDDSGDEPLDRRATRLTHDTLAPLIRREFDNSANPGQLARRVIENRAVEWVNGLKGTPLDERDLTLVEGGELGMRRWTADEQRLVDTSRAERVARERLRRRARAGVLGAVLVVVALAGFASTQWWRAESERAEANLQREKSLARQLVAQAELIRSERPELLDLSVLLAIEGMKRFPSAEADQALRQGLALLPRALRTLGHESIVNAVAFSPDGRFVATASWSNPARIWEAGTGREIARLEHGGIVNGIAFSPDSKLLATASSDGTAGVWEVSNGRRVHQLKHDSIDVTTMTITRAGGGPSRIERERAAVYAVAFSPDGEILATASQDKSARVWDVNSGRALVRLEHNGPVKAVAFSPDGRLLATGSEDKSARIWEVAHGRELRRLEHTDRVAAVAFSPDGRLLASSGYDHKAHLWEAMSGRSIVALDHDGPVETVKFSPDGRYLATASWDGTTLVREASSGRVVVLRHQGAVQALSFSSDSRLLATASQDRTARLWSLPSGSEIARFSHEDRVEDVALSPDGTQLATASYDHTARLWTTQTGGQVASLKPDGMGRPARVDALAFGPDQTVLATVDKVRRTLRLWNVAAGPQSPRRTIRGDAGAIALTSQGVYLAATFGDSVYFWPVSDTASGKVLRLPDSHIRDDFKRRGSIEVSSVVFSADGRYLTKSVDGVTRVWQIRDGQATTRFTFDKSLTCIAFSADSRFLATSRPDSGSTLDSRIEVWELESGRQVAAFTHDGAAVFIALSPDARYLVTPAPKPMENVFGERSSVPGSDLRIWDPAKGKLVATLQHSAAVTAAVFNPDGQHLAAALADGVTSVWAIAPSGGVALARVHQAATINDIRFSTDGRYLATAGDDGTTRVWLWRSEDLMREACGRLTRNLTFEERQLYLSDQSYDKTCEKLPIHPSFVDAGRVLAKAGDTLRAVSIFERARALGAEQKLEPRSEARRLAGVGLIETGERLATRGQIREAIEAFSKAVKINPLLETSGRSLNEICWQGSLRGYAVRVMDACDRAVWADSTNFHIRDSRGLSRALAGNRVGAIEDFALYVKWGETNQSKVSAEELERRRHWIRELQAGRNPFDDATLRSLR